MRNKGFTLIELLAVIVILAIIALIATPIILGIIKDSKKESDKRSIEMYAKALENAVAKYQLGGEKLEVSKLETTDGRTFSNSKLKVDYDGDVVCKTIEVYEDGKIYLNNCEVNGKEVEYKYGKSNIPEPESFATDLWETIVANINSDKYKVGDTREIELKEFENGETDENGVQIKTYTIRIANTSTPDECSAEGFSQTACGFVIEFEDIITTHNMNSDSKNQDGYPASELYKFINEEKDDTTTSIYESLPEELKDVIIDTKVVSSHGNKSGAANIVTTDKLYLLSTKEVWGKEGTSSIITNDTAELETRQLDYYKDVAKVTTTSSSGAKKKYSGSGHSWWLRSAFYKNYSYNFYDVDYYGDWHYGTATYTRGVAVAFRIGKSE